MQCNLFRDSRKNSDFYISCATNSVLFKKKFEFKVLCFYHGFKDFKMESLGEKKSS